MLLELASEGGAAHGCQVEELLQVYRFAIVGEDVAYRLPNCFLVGVGAGERKGPCGERQNLGIGSVGYFGEDGEECGQAKESCEGSEVLHSLPRIGCRAAFYVEAAARPFRQSLERARFDEVPDSVFEREIPLDRESG